MKRLLCLILILVLSVGLLAACGKDPGTAGGEGGGNEPAATPESTPEPTPEPYNAQLLTGYEKDSSYPDNQRPVAIMFNNLIDARPQNGLSDAEIVVEIKVEGGITRFMGIFDDWSDLDKIGPIRSARDQYLKLIMPWQMLYVHDGQSVVVDYMVRDYDYDEFNLKQVGSFAWREKDRYNWAGKTNLATEHTEYTDGEHLADYITDQGVDTFRDYGESTFFNFVDYREPARQLSGDEVTVAEQVTVQHSSSYRTRLTYDSSLNLYYMSQYYGKSGYLDTIDQNNDQQLAFDNVVVLFTDIYTYPEYREKDLQYVDYDFGGYGYYIYGGKAERIRWVKGVPEQALRLVQLDGSTPYEINCGKTYLAVVDLDEFNNFTCEALTTSEG